MSSYLIRSSSNTHESTGRTPVGPRTIILLTYPTKMINVLMIRDWIENWWVERTCQYSHLVSRQFRMKIPIFPLSNSNQNFRALLQFVIVDHLFLKSIEYVSCLYKNSMYNLHFCKNRKLQNHQTVKKSSYPIPLLMTSTHNYEPYHLKSKTYKNTQKTEWKSSLTV